jgi:hypothetical protein
MKEILPRPMRRAVLVSIFLLAGCGRPATKDDCERIVQRIVELELKEAKITDAENVREQVKETKNAFRQRAMRECVGKRITDRALACVRTAKTSKELVDGCFD